MATKVKYDSIGVDLYMKKDNNALTVEKAKEYLGWLEERAGEFQKEFLFRDIDGNKIRLANNVTNRPFRMTLAKRYANEILRGKWSFNGETMVFDRLGFCQDGQHRLVGFVLAEQIRQQNPDHWKQYGVKGPVTIDALIVTGISEKPEVVDTLNLGQKRSLGDVIFRNHEFGGELSDKDQKRLSNILAHATRLVWLRAGGRTVSDAPHFPHSEALDFVKHHPRLNDAVAFIWEEDGGRGAEGKRISTYVSLGYAAGLLYLMGTAATDPDKYHTEGPEALDYSLWEKATEFWVEFANGTSETIAVLQRLLVQAEAGGASGRDEIIGMIVKTFNAWMDGQKLSAKEIKIKRVKDKESGTMVPAEEPRLGGIDASVELEEVSPEEAEEPAEEAPAPEPEAKPAKKPRKPRKKAVETKSQEDQKGSRAGETWAAGDTAWVKDDDGEHWFGAIAGLSDDGHIAFVVAEATPDKQWEIEVKDLQLNRPKGKKKKAA